MSAKNNKNTHNQSNKSTGGYKIKSEAVVRLINADKKTYPDSKTDPGKQYRSQGFFDRIPSGVKALFIKFWFNGAVCFFIYWGLGMYVRSFWDMSFILAIVLGMVNDLLVNNAFHFFAVTPGSNNKWMMFPKKKFWTFIANILYSFVVLACVIAIYGVINLVVFTGVEPILFGLLYMAVDMLFVGMKNLTLKIISDAKEKVDSK